MGKKDELHTLFDRIAGNVLAKYRTNMDGVSQEDLARIAGVHRQWISRVETGKSGSSLYNFFRYADAIGIDIVEAVKDIRDEYVKEAKPIMMAAEDAKYRKYLEQAKKNRLR